MAEEVAAHPLATPPRDHQGHPAQGQASTIQLHGTLGTNANINGPCDHEEAEDGKSEYQQGQVHGGHWGWVGLLQRRKEEDLVTGVLRWTMVATPVEAPGPA